MGVGLESVVVALRISVMGPRVLLFPLAHRLGPVWEGPEWIGANE